MAQLELLVSPPGTGKTTYCIDLFREEVGKSRAGLDSRCYFILPSREHAERVQNLVLKTGVPGLFNAHILSMNDLAPRLLRSGAAMRPTDSMRRSIVRRILSGEASTGAFGYFEAVKNFHGFHELLADAIKEFSAGLIRVPEFEKVAQPLIKDPVFRSKFRDFSMVLKNYDLELKRLGLEEAEEDILRLKSGEDVTEKPDVVIFDGFYHFTRAQRALIGVVARHARRVVVTLTLPDRAETKEHLFEYPERTRAFLREAGFKEKKNAAPASFRVSDPALLHLEKNLFLTNAVVFDGSASAVQRIEAPSEQAEIEIIARRIRQLYRSRTIHFSDICLIFRSVGSYEKLIRSVFSEFEIPVQIHERHQLIQNGLVLTLYRFFEVLRQNWKREDLMFVMKSSFFSGLVSIEEVIALETASLKENVNLGRENWVRLAQAPEISARVRKFLTFLGLWESHFLDARSVRMFSAHVERFLASMDGGDASKDIRREDFEALSSLKASLQSARKYYETSGAHEFSAGNFVEEFQESIERGLFSVKPEGKNRVQVYDAVMALPKEFKIVFIGGLLEKSFPQSISEDPLFKDRERRVMNRKETLLEERLWRAAGERYFFYMAVTRARELLCLSYPAYSAQGKPTQPSFFIDEVERCFKPGSVAVTRKTLGDFLPDQDDWETGSDVLRGIGEGLFSPEAPAEAAGVLLPLYNARTGSAPLLRLAGYAARPQGGQISDPAAKKEFSRLENIYSPTRLETYAKCAFHYFSSKILSLNEPLSGRVEAEMGTMLHDTLDEFFKGITEADRRTRVYLKDPAQAKAGLRAILERRMAGGPFRNEALYRQKMHLESMKSALDSFVDHEAALDAARGLVPTHFEIGFGKKVKGELEYLRIAGGKEPVLIGGKIDRIDISADGKSALIIDYKRSQRNLLKKIEEGLELQLPIYMLAAKRLLGLRVMGAEHRILTKPGKQGVYLEEFSELLDAGEKQVRTEMQMDAYLAGIETAIAAIADRIRSADISVKSRSCDYCEYDPVCRFEKWKLVYEKN